MSFDATKHDQRSELVRHLADQLRNGWVGLAVGEAAADELERLEDIANLLGRAALSETRRPTASEVLQVIVDYHRITSGEFNAKYPDKQTWDTEQLIDWAEREAS